MRMALLSTVLLLISACGDDGPPSTPGDDAAVAEDARPPGPDGSPIDSSTPDPDTGTGTDAGDGADGGTIDAGSTADAGTGTDAAVAPDAGILGNDCIDDADCAPVGFCRDKMGGGGRECVAWSGEGDGCGGFTPSWGVRRCEPGLSCIERSPLIADAPGNCGLLATLSEILADKTMYDGRFVGILTGWILSGPAACTEIACSPSMPCCNSCGSGENLHGINDPFSPSIELRDDMSVPYTCTGTECNPTETCTAEPGFEYRVLGTYHETGNYIDVYSASRISFP